MSQSAEARNIAYDLAMFCSETKWRNNPKFKIKVEDTDKKSGSLNIIDNKKLLTRYEKSWLHSEWMTFSEFKVTVTVE